MSVNSQPIRSASHRKEDKSKRAFEELIDPFFVTGWTQRDYGIDAVIEITTNSINDVELESKCFLAQLKATDKIKISGNVISYPIEAKKILYWYNYNLPVLFVLYDCKDQCFYHRWVDETLIAQLDAERPNWGKQKSVTIKIELSGKLEKHSIDVLKSYVLKWKTPTRRKLEPGKYFELRSKGHELIAEYKKLTEPFNFTSVNESIKVFETDIDLSIYRVALTGLSRVGKSSLINALLKKKISPTGFYQTTGVPIQIIPGHENKLNVFFHDGNSKSMPFSLEQIEQFASQDFNENNQKHVRLVSVSVKNDLLERGVSLFDIPGLDDPSDDVLEYTWQTVRKVNAIIYVIDASPAEDGGYIFKNDYKKHITTFSQSQDKVFLVFNKSDKLSVNTLNRLKERVAQDLVKHNLAESIGTKVFYLSAEKETTNGDMDSVEQLNESLWDFILSENKFGIVKLNLLNQEVAKSSASFIEILQARLINSKKRLELEESIKIVKGKMSHLTNSFGQKRNISCKLILDYLENKQHTILNNLESVLKAVPGNQPLPGSSEIKKYLADGRNQAMEHANNEYALQVNQLKVFVDEWIEENLKQVREILSANVDQRIIDFAEIETFESPQADISSAWGMGAIGLVAGLLIAPAAAVFAGLIGFFGNLFTSSENIRSKQIVKILERSRERYEISFEKLRSAYTELMNEQTNALNGYVTRKLSFFFNDLQRQMIKFDKPFSPFEMEESQSVLNQVVTLQAKMNEFDAELRSFQFV